MHKMSITVELAEVDRDAGLDDIIVTCHEADCLFGPMMALNMEHARATARDHRRYACDHDLNATQVEGTIWECDDCGMEFVDSERGL
jgi:hypothetical protein